MDLPGAEQMKHVRKLMEAGPITERVPDQSLIVENNLTPGERIQATRGKDYAYVYTASGKPFTVHLGKISGATLNVGWYDPRTGKYEAAGTTENKGDKQFTPPSAGYGKDWVLVLQDTARPVSL
jgi:hypothetical protein